MAINPRYLVAFTMQDYSGEMSTVQVHGDIGAETLAAAVQSGAGSPMENFSLALITLSNGERVSQTVTAIRRITLQNTTTSETQRELKYLVRYFDEVTLARYSFEIPCADVGTEAWFKQNTDELDLSNATVAAAVTQIETDVRSPDGNPIEVIGITLVGRNI